MQLHSIKCGIIQIFSYPQRSLDIVLKKAKPERVLLLLAVRIRLKKAISVLMGRRRNKKI